MNAPARTLACVVALVGIWIGGAQAQSLSPQPSRPLFSIKGWKNGTSPSGMQMAACQPPVCASESVVMYSLRPADPALTFEKYKVTEQRQFDFMRQAAASRGIQYEFLGVSDASKPGLRMFKTRYLMKTSDGKKLSFVSGDVAGTHYTAKVTSSAITEKEADANFMQFAAPLYLFANDKIEKNVKGL